jgi:hypothetical protein
MRLTGFHQRAVQRFSDLDANAASEKGHDCEQAFHASSTTDKLAPSATLLSSA